MRNGTHSSSLATLCAHYGRAQGPKRGNMDRQIDEEHRRTDDGVLVTVQHTPKDGVCGTGSIHVVLTLGRGVGCRIQETLCRHRISEELEGTQRDCRISCRSCLRASHFLLREVP